MDEVKRTAQTLINKTETPPGGWKFLCKDTGVWIKQPSFEELVRDVKKHYRANNIPIGLLIEQQIETQICETMPPGRCTFSDEKQKRRAAQIARPSITQVDEFTKTLVKRWLGDGLTSPEEATEHAKICARCEFNQKPDGCTSCNAPATDTAIGIAFGTIRKQTAYDDRLTACLICKCHLKAKVWAKPETVRNDPDIVDVLPDWCWIRAENNPTLPHKVVDATE